MRIKNIALLIVCCSLLIHAEEIDSNTPVILKPSPVVEVEGMSADELTDMQLREFLRKKIHYVYHSAANVELIRVAPGYAVSLIFDQPLEAIILGDPSLVAYKQHQNLLVLSATQRQGDTSLQLLFKSGELLNYHVFIAQNYVDAQSTFHVHVVTNEESTRKYGISEVSSIIRNFDILKQEGALLDSEVSRVPIMRRSGEFEYYDLYRFPNGSTAMTFAVTNQSASTRKLQPGRLRLKFAHSHYRPRYASLHRNELPVNQSTTGFIFFEKPPFTWDQPFNLVWR